MIRLLGISLIHIDEIDEFSIGHSIVARASLVGMEKAVQEMIRLTKEL